MQRLNVPLDLVRPLGPVGPVGPVGPLGPLGSAVGSVSTILRVHDGQPIPISCTFFIKHVV